MFEKTNDHRRLLAAVDKLEQAMAILKTDNAGEVSLRHRIAEITDAVCSLAYSKDARPSTSAGNIVQFRASPNR